jgi:hypothetical protein
VESIAFTVPSILPPNRLSPARVSSPHFNRERAMIKTHHFTADDLRSKLNYDRETGLFTDHEGRVRGTLNKKGYLVLTVLGRTCRAHRLAWLYEKGEWPADQIDHINGVKNDNRIANLREATNRQNVQNRPAQANNKLGIRGVRQHPRTKLYEAWIWVNGKRTFVGCFKDPQLAGEAYAKAARKHFGDFCHQSITTVSS